MTSETKPLTGLELRKACLIAAGWSIRVSPKGGVWQLVDPDGHILFELTRNADESEDYAWEKLAPAVESSVDAALTYLKGIRFQINLDEYGYYLHLHQGELGTDTLGYAEDVPALATLVCQAWLEWKGRE